MPKHLVCCAECLTGHGLHPVQESSIWLCNAWTSRVTLLKGFTGQEREHIHSTIIKFISTQGIPTNEITFLIGRMLQSALGKLAAPTLLQSSTTVPKWEGKSHLQLSLSTLQVVIKSKKSGLLHLYYTCCVLQSIIYIL